MNMSAPQSKPRHSSTLSWRSSTSIKPWADNGPVKAKQGTSRGKVDFQIDSNAAAQEIDGWGGCFNELGWDAMSVLKSTEREAVIKALFDPEVGCKFNICRMPMGASDFALDYYSLNDHAGDYRMEKFSLARDRQYLIPFIKAAMRYRPDLKIWGSPWTPPAWMKTNGLYYQGQLTWKQEILEAYALYFSKYVQAYRAEGIDVYAVHVQNEPLHLPTFPSCWWEGRQMRDFIRDYLGPRFKADKVDAEIWLGTINGEKPFDSYVDWVDPVLRDPVANAFVTGCGFQWFGNVCTPLVRQNYPSKRLMQSETKCGNGSNDWTYAEETFELMCWYLENGVNSYMQWNMVLDETGDSTWGWKQSAMVTVDRAKRKAIFNPQFYLVKHFTHFVQPGARLLQTGGTMTDKIAFRNPDGSLVIVLGNRTDRKISAAFTVDGICYDLVLPPRSFHTLTRQA